MGNFFLDLVVTSFVQKKLFSCQKLSNMPLKESFLFKINKNFQSNIIKICLNCPFGNLGRLSGCPNCLFRFREIPSKYLKTVCLAALTAHASCCLDNLSDFLDCLLTYLDFLSGYLVNLFGYLGCLSCFTNSLLDCVDLLPHFLFI